MPLDSTTYTEPLTETEQEAKEDLFRWLDRFPDRVPALLEAVRDGRLLGHTFYGKCRCVIGNLHHDENYTKWVPGVLEMAGYRMAHEMTPIERFVMHIHPGDTPSNSPVMAHLERWILEWMA